MKRTIVTVEIARMIGKVYKNDKLIVDWSSILPTGKKDDELVVLCYDSKSARAWIESPTIEEEKQTESFYLTH
jgi:hypothetical protein